MMSSATITRPVLRYPGGKFLLAAWVMAYQPPCRVYVEPMAGAASVLLQRPRVYAEVLNDRDEEIVSLFRVLRDPRQATELERLLRLTPFAATEFTAAYEPAACPVEAARRLLVRSYLGFAGHGVFRHPTSFRNNTGRTGSIAAHDWASWPEVVGALSVRLRGVVIENRPATEVIRAHDAPDTLFYVDPPYVTKTRGERWQQTYRHELTDDDHRELAAVLRAVRGMVVLSGYPCSLYDVELYPDWHRVTREARADGARLRVEVLWLNPLAWERLEAARGQQSLGLEETL